MEIKLSLEALDSTDMGLVRRWRNDYRVWKWCRQTGPISDAEQVRWFNRQSEDPTIRMFKVAAELDGKKAPVGVCGLTSIDRLNSRAEFSLYIAPEAQGRGMGRLALSLLLDMAFDTFGLNLVWGESFDDNPAIKMFLALGFVREGVRREHYWRDGKFVGAHLFSITRREWAERRSSLTGSRPNPEPAGASTGGDGHVGNGLDNSKEGAGRKTRRIRALPATQAN